MTAEAVPAPVRADIVITCAPSRDRSERAAASGRGTAFDFAAF